MHISLIILISVEMLKLSSQRYTFLLPQTPFPPPKHPLPNSQAYMRIVNFNPSPFIL